MRTRFSSDMLSIVAAYSYANDTTAPSRGLCADSARLSANAWAIPPGTGFNGLETLISGTPLGVYGERAASPGCPR